MSGFGSKSDVAVGVSPTVDAQPSPAQAPGKRTLTEQVPVAPRPQSDIKADLRKAVDGLGTDEDAIYARIERATPAEILAVATDGNLIARVDDDLSGDELDR